MSDTGFWDAVIAHGEQRTERQGNRKKARVKMVDSRQEGRSDRSGSRNERKAQVQTARAETGTNLGGTLTQRGRTKAAMALGLAGKTEAAVAMAQGAGTFGNAGGGFVEGGGGDNTGLYILGGLALGGIGLFALRPSKGN